MALSSWPTPEPNLIPSITPFLTFADIDYYLESSSRVGLWENGCLVDVERNEYNCTKVCTDSKLLFLSPASEGKDSRGYTMWNGTAQANSRVSYNIYNCMMYPYISALISDPTAPQAAQDNAHILAEKMVILPDANSTQYENTSLTILERIEDVQQRCVTDYCVNEKCAAGLTWDDFTSSDGMRSQNGTVLTKYTNIKFPHWHSVSDHDDMNVYSDVAGIGVSIAFAIEVSLMACCWLFMWFIRYRKLLNDPDNPKFRDFHRKLLGHLESEFIPRKIRRASTNLSRRLSTTNPLNDDGLPIDEKSITNTVLEAMVSFQNTQCFFLISMNVAILIGLASDGPFMMSGSLGQYWNNLLYTQAISESSLAFAACTQYCLHAVHKNSIYSLTLVVLTFISCVATWAVAQQYSGMTDTMRLVLNTANPQLDYWQQSCGMVSPATYNGSLRISARSEIFTNAKTFGIWILAFAASVVVTLNLGLLWRRWLKVNSQRHRWLYNTVFGTFYLLIELCIWVWIFTFIYYFWYPLYTVLPQQWSLGQVLAVSIWIPGVIEWIHAGLKLLLKGRIMLWIDKLLQRSKTVRRLASVRRRKSHAVPMSDPESNEMVEEIIPAMKGVTTPATEESHGAATPLFQEFDEQQMMNTRAARP